MYMHSTKHSVYSIILPLVLNKWFCEFKTYVQEMSKKQHSARQNTAPWVVQQVPTQFLHFEVNCYNVRQHAAQHLQALLRNWELLAYCEQLEVRVGEKAPRYHLPAPTTWKLRLLFKGNLDFYPLQNSCHHSCRSHELSAPQEQSAN